MRSRVHRGVVFEGLSERDRERLDAFLATLGQPMRTTDVHPGKPTPKPVPPPAKKRGRR